MSTQLRLVGTSETTPRRRRSAARSRGRITTPRGRRVRWDADWRLDAPTRRAGREGVAAARAALEQAQRPDAPLSKAS